MVNFLLLLLHLFFLILLSITSGYAQIRQLKTTTEQTKKDITSGQSGIRKQVALQDSLWKKEVHKWSPNYLLNNLKTKTSQNKDSLKSSTHSKLSAFQNLYKSDSASLKKIHLPTFIKLTNGQAVLMQQIAQREGVFPVQSPPTFTRLTVNGGVGLLGIPLRVNALYSTEQNSDIRQPMNRIGVSLDLPQLKKQYLNRLDNKINQLETYARSDGLKDLEKVYNLEEIGGNDLLRSPNLEEYLKKSTLADSVKRVSSHLSNRGKQKLKSVEDSLYQVYRREREAQIRQGNQYRQTLQDSAQHRLHKRMTKEENKKNGKARLAKQRYEKSKLNSKVKKHLANQPVSHEEFQKLIRLRDSLRRADPERMVAYESIRLLKTYKQQGLGKSMQQLNGLHIYSPLEKLLSSVEKFSIGTDYPNYSFYTLRSIPVTGFHAELQPGLLHLAVDASKNLSSVASTQTYSRQLSAGQVGIGRKAEDHLYLTFMHGKDDKKSFGQDTLSLNWPPTNGQVGQLILDSTFYGKPRNNYVIGTDFRLHLNRWLVAEGEAVQAVTAMDTHLKEISQRDASRYLMAPLFSHPTDDSLSVVKTGQAYGLKLQAQIAEQTKFSIKGEQVSKDFYSLGAPYLRNNLIRYEMEVEQYLWQKQLMVTPRYGQWKGKEAPEGQTNPYAALYGVKMKASFRKLPYLVLDYLTMRPQKGSDTITSNQYVTNLLHCTSGYTYPLGILNSQTSMSGSWQSTVHPNNQNLMNRSIRNLQINQTLSLPFPLQIAATASLTRVTDPKRLENWRTAGLTATYTYRAIWQNSLGFTKGRTQEEGKRENRFIESRIKMGRFVDIAMRAEYNELSIGEKLRDYREWRGVITLTGRW